jgi:hypothetical protein
METVSKNTIFGLKMMVKSGLEKYILKSLHVGRWLFLILYTFMKFGKIVSRMEEFQKYFF